MAYTTNPGPAAGDELPGAESLGAGAGAPPEQGAAGYDEGATATLPDAVLGGKTFNPGDEIVLQVVGPTEGGIIVKYASDSGEGEADKEGSWEDDFRKDMSPQQPQEAAM